MFIEVQDPSERTVWLNTNAIAYVRDYADRDLTVIYFTDGAEVRLEHGEMKKIAKALRLCQAL